MFYLLVFYSHWIINGYTVGYSCFQKLISVLAIVIPVPEISLFALDINLATDHCPNTLEHQLGRRSLSRQCRTSTWLLIIVRTFWNINLATDHCPKTLEHQLGCRLLSQYSRTSTWLPIIFPTLWNINLSADPLT